MVEAAFLAAAGGLGVERTRAWTASCAAADWVQDEHDGLYKASDVQLVANGHNHDLENAAVSAASVQPSILGALVGCRSEVTAVPSPTMEVKYCSKISDDGRPGCTVVLGHGSSRHQSWQWSKVWRMVARLLPRISVANVGRQ